MSKEYAKTGKTSAFRASLQLQRTDGLADSLPFSVIEAGRFRMPLDSAEMDCGAEGYALIFVTSGAAEILQNASHAVLQSGDVAMLDCRTEYKLTAAGADEALVSWVRIRGESCKYYHDVLRENGRLKYTLQNGAEVDLCLELIAASLPRGNTTNLFRLSNAVSRLLTALILARFASADRRSVTPEYEESISDVVDFVNQNYWQPISLDELANSVGLSKFYFSRLFKAHMNISPYKYLMEQRIAAAKRLLETTDSKVSDVGIMVGFRDESHFNRAFKTAVGVTPLQYRKATSAAMK